jgi:hypothetical protein
MFNDMQLLINHAFLTGAVLILFTKPIIKAEGLNWSSSKFIKPFKGLLIHGTRSNAVPDAKTSQKTCRERVRQPPNNHEQGQLKTSDSPVFLSCTQDHISSQVSSEKQVLKLPA